MYTQIHKFDLNSKSLSSSKHIICINRRYLSIKLKWRVKSFTSTCQFIFDTGHSGNVFTASQLVWHLIWQNKAHNFQTRNTQKSHEHEISYIHVILHLSQPCRLDCQFSYNIASSPAFIVVSLVTILHLPQPSVLSV